MQQSTQFNVYDKESAAFFHQYMKKYPKLYQNLVNILQREIPDSETQQRILDMGMGPGLLLEEIQKKFPQACILGIDQSQAMIQQAQKKTIQNAHILQANAEALPLCSNTIDAVTSRFVLYVVKNPLKAIQELYRIIKPKGVLVIEGLNKQYPQWKKNLVRVQMKLKQAPAAVIAYHYDAYNDAYDVEELIRLLQQTGFQIKNVRTKPKNWKYLIIASK